MNARHEAVSAAALALAAVLLARPPVVFAAHLHAYSNYTGPYEFDELSCTVETSGGGMFQSWKGTARVTGYTGSQVDLVIPKKVSWFADIFFRVKVEMP